MHSQCRSAFTVDRPAWQVRESRDNRIVSALPSFVELTLDPGRLRSWRRARQRRGNSLREGEIVAMLQRALGDR